MARHASSLLSYGWPAPRYEYRDGSGMPPRRVAELNRKGVSVNVEDAEQARAVLQALGFGRDWIEFRLRVAERVEH